MTGRKKEEGRMRKRREVLGENEGVVFKTRRIMGLQREKESADGRSCGNTADAHVKH